MPPPISTVLGDTLIMLGAAKLQPLKLTVDDPTVTAIPEPEPGKVGVAMICVSETKVMLAALTPPKVTELRALVLMPVKYWPLMVTWVPAAPAPTGLGDAEEIVGAR